MRWADFVAWVNQSKPDVMIDLYNWQTLIAGGLALFGALVTVWHIRRQIRQADVLAKQRLHREEDAAKAVLPLALSAIIQYAIDCIKLIARYAPGTDVVPDVPADVAVTRIPPNVIVTFQTCARFADPPVVEQIATLLSKLQVQHARMEALFSRSVGRRMHAHEGIDLLITTADLYATVGTLFAYARDEDALRRRAPRADLRTAFVVSGLYEETHPPLYEKLNEMP